MRVYDIPLQEITIHEQGQDAAKCITLTKHSQDATDGYHRHRTFTSGTILGPDQKCPELRRAKGERDAISQHPVRHLRLAEAWAPVVYLSHGISHDRCVDLDGADFLEAQQQFAWRRAGSKLVDEKKREMGYIPEGPVTHVGGTPA